MKKWVRPLTEVQNFVANEYVAACGDSGKTYIFECNAKAGPLYYYKSDTSNKASYIGSFHPNTEVEHIVESTEIFYDGFIDYNYNNTKDAGESVIVYIEWNKYGGIKDAHATSELKIEDWETAKS